ncbi:MAG TPA: hypothetical protein VF615_15325 [Longimicrobiaceae bacterium]|jgi:uncharacterized membrane protein
MSNPYVGQDAASPQVASARGLATAVYALQAASFVLGFTVFIGLVINYIKMDEVRGTWVESHFRWQIRTAWLWLAFGLLLTIGLVMLVLGTAGAAVAGSEAGAMGGMLSVTTVGLVGGLGLAAWFVYRIVKGWLRLAANQPI